MVYSCRPNIGILQITSLQTVPLFRVSLESDLTNPLLGYIYNEYPCQIKLATVWSEITNWLQFYNSYYRAIDMLQFLLLHG